MNIYSDSFFREYRRSVPEITFKAHVREAQIVSSETTFDIFLSYNINDKEVIEGVYYYLTCLGKKVYLDFIVDPTLSRSNASAETAKKIHNRIKHSRSLVYAISCNSSESKWMPWELGVADGDSSPCYLLPVSSAYHKDFERKEYLLLYPILEKGAIPYGGESMVYKNNYGNIQSFR